MDYVNRVGHVSVPEDLWAEMVNGVEQFVDMQDYVIALWANLESPERQQTLSQSHNEWVAVLQRARELDERRH